MPDRPDPHAELRLVSLSTLQGSNYWCRCPATRIDLAVGAYDWISSADAPGLTDQLLRALPGLHEHRCSVARSGGFVTRLRQGTYAPHILEHVALELQSMIGHDVGFGRARGGDRPGEYTVVYEHRHSGVGRRSAELALDLVRAAFRGELGGIDGMIQELRAVEARDEPTDLPRQHVACGVFGNADPAVVRQAIVRAARTGPDSVVCVAPEDLLREGLSYASSDTAVVLDTAPGRLPDRYRDAAGVRRLCATVLEAVPEDGFVVIPAGNGELERIAREAGLTAARFGVDASASIGALHAVPEAGHVVVHDGTRPVMRVPLDRELSTEVHLAAVLAAHVLDRSRR